MRTKTSAGRMRARRKLSAPQQSNLFMRTETSAGRTPQPERYRKASVYTVKEVVVQKHSQVSASTMFDKVLVAIAGDTVLRITYT